MRSSSPRRHALDQISHARQQPGIVLAKYGALSTEDGHVVIVWETEGKGDDRRLILHWEESGGPKVVQGFGSRLIERALAAELGGEVRVQYEFLRSNLHDRCTDARRA